MRDYHNSDSVYPAVFRRLPDGSAREKGEAGKVCDFLRENQLCDSDLWARFVNEFRTRIDPSNSGWRGEYWGKMMRGAVTVYQYKPDDKLYSVLEETVLDLLSTEDGQGRISSFPPEREFFAWDTWCRKYVMLGLEFFLEICGDEELKERIVASLCRQCDYICAHVGDGKIPVTKTSTAWGGMNSSSILEPVIRLYKLAPKDEYLAFAKHIIACGGSSFANIFESAREDAKAPYAYGVSKAYEMISCFEGLLEYYRLTGDCDARDTVLKFARQVAKTDVTVIGSSGCTHELFDNSFARQTADVPDGTIMQETCVTVTWLKFCEKLLALTGDASWAELAEKAFYNAYLGAFNPELHRSRDVKKKLADGTVTKFTPIYFDSYSPLTAGYRGLKTGGFQVMSDGGYFGCCACIAAAGAGIFANSQVFASGDGYAVAGFEDGTYKLGSDENACSIRISGNYPFGDGRCVITVNVERPVRFVLRVRDGGKARLTCEGREYKSENGWFVIDRQWLDGTELEYFWDTALKITRAPQYEKTMTYNIDWKKGVMYAGDFYQTDREKRKISLSRGPVVLAAEEGYTMDDIAKTLTPVELPSIDVNACDGRRMVAEVPMADGGTLRFCDYASAGQGWDRKIACWLDS